MSDTTYNVFQHYGTNAERLAFVPNPAAAIKPLYIWYETDTNNVFIYTTAWKGPFNATAAPAARPSAVGLVIDGGVAPITAGLKGYLEMPFACTIQAVTLLADQVGSIVFDIWKDTYANFPPTVADTITAAAKPTITAALKSQDTTLVGWNTAVVAGDILAFNVDSVATITKVTLSLKVLVP